MPPLYRAMAGRDPAEVLAAMTPEELDAIASDPALRRLPYQAPPADDWRLWVLLGGRGIGKTFTISTLVHEVAMEPERLDGGIIAIVGRSFTDVRSTNVEAKATGILASAPDGFRPRWQPGHGTLTWPNGVVGRVFAATEPDSGRGPNSAFLVLDELMAYKKPREVWDVFTMGCRVGRAQIVIATTPKPSRFLRELCKGVHVARPHVSQASTYDNPYLSREALERLARAYKGTRLERQELHGVIMDAISGALLPGDLVIGRVDRRELGDLAEVVVAVDPAVTEHKRSDATGIVVYGVERGRILDSSGERVDRGVVLEDLTGDYGITNGEWVRVVVDAFRRHRADRVVVEVNRGGKHVIAGLRADRHGAGLPIVEVNASRGKVTRASPVGLLYEQGRIVHAGDFPLLTGELYSWVEGDPSPNALDALVWAATHCHQLDPRQAGPRTGNALAALSW
jgi:phage terminase large subunit-like protein